MIAGRTQTPAEEQVPAPGHVPPAFATKVQAWFTQAPRAQAFARGPGQSVSAAHATHAPDAHLLVVPEQTVHAAPQ